MFSCKEKSYLEYNDLPPEIRETIPEKVDAYAGNVLSEAKNSWMVVIVNYEIMEFRDSLIQENIKKLEEDKLINIKPVAEKLHPDLMLQIDNTTRDFSNSLDKYSNGEARFFKMKDELVEEFKNTLVQKQLDRNESEIRKAHIKY